MKYTESRKLEQGVIYSPAMRESFDLNPELIYLNSGNLSLCPRKVNQALERYHREFESNPTVGLKEAWGKLWESQCALADFLSARPEDLFLKTNVTQVLNSFLLGLPLEKGSEMLVGELEYGAIVNVCRLRAERDNLSWRVLKLPTNVVATRRATADSLLENILSQLGPKTRLVLLSHVIGGTGLVLPIREIGKALRRRNVFFVVDGAYAPGALSVDFRDLEEVDCYGSSLYKFLLGPKGTAFGWVSPLRQPLLQPLQAGWGTRSGFLGKSEFQNKFILSGCQDFPPFFAIKDTLEFWKEQGAEKIRARMHALRTYLRNHCRWELLRSEDEALNGPLLAFKGSIPDLYETHRIQAHPLEIQGSQYLVFSPHIYNTEEELQRVLDVLR